MKKTFVEEATEILRSIPPSKSDEENMVHHALKAALEKLCIIIDQADAQFRAGDRYATFNKQTIDSIR